MLKHFTYNSVCLTKKTLKKEINPGLSRRLGVSQDAVPRGSAAVTLPRAASSCHTG